MSSNSGLDREKAVALLRGEKIACPKCGEAALLSRYPHKKQNVEYKCPACGEIYHPCKAV